MALERMGIQPFQTEEVGSAGKRAFTVLPDVEKKDNRRRKNKSLKGELALSKGLAIKIGVCVAACAAMLGLKEIDAPIAAQMVSGVKSAITEETDIDEMLGKLHFVELPETLEVFSGETKMSLPVSAPNSLMQEEAEYVLWEDVPNAVVTASAGGVVRAVGEDSILGNYVRLLHDGELETIYYGFNSISVEEGQPIRKHDTLGTLTEEGILRLSVLLGGRPQAPLDYLEMAEAK